MGKDQCLLRRLDAADQFRIQSSLRNDLAEDLPDRSAGRHVVLRQSEQFGKPDIADDQTLVHVDHAQSLRHVVQRGIEARVLGVQLVIARLQDLVAITHFVHRRDRALVRRGQLIAGMGQVVDQQIDLVVRRHQQAVMPAQHTDQHEPACDQGNQNARENPMQPTELRLVGRCQRPALDMGSRSQPHELAVHRLQMRQQLSDTARPVQAIQHQLRGRNGVAHVVRNFGQAGRGPYQSSHLRVVEHPDAIDDNIEPKLHIVGSQQGTGHRIGRHGAVKPRHLGRCLAEQPCRVVAGDGIERCLPLHDQKGNIGREQHQEAGDAGEDNLEVELRARRTGHAAERIPEPR